jgi:hypothetical protein
MVFDGCLVHLRATHPRTAGYGGRQIAQMKGQHHRCRRHDGIRKSEPAGVGGGRMAAVGGTRCGSGGPPLANHRRDRVAEAHRQQPQAARMVAAQGCALQAEG